MIIYLLYLYLYLTKKDTLTVGCFDFWELDQIFQVFLSSSVAQLSTSLGSKIHLILSKSESFISLEIRAGQN